MVLKNFVDSSGSYVYINRVTPRRRMKWINVAKTIFMCSSSTTPGADGYVLDPNNALIDGLRNVEDIALPDSMGHTFLALTDGSYVLSVDGKEELRGEIYQIRDGVITRVNHGDVTY